MMQEDLEAAAATVAASPDLSALVIPLLKGVIYQESDAGLWNALLTLQSRVRDYVAVLDLELVLDEAEGYAFLRARPEAPDGTAVDDRGDKLIAYRCARDMHCRGLHCRGQF